MIYRKPLQLVSVLILAAGAMLAQGPGSGRGMRAQGMAGTPNGNRLDFLATFLDLSTAQKASAQTIFDNAKTAAAPLATQVKDNRTAIQTAIESGATDGALTTLTSAQGALMGELAFIRAQAARAFYAILSQAQKDKLAKAPHGFMGLLGGGSGRF